MHVWNQVTGQERGWGLSQANRPSCYAALDNL